MWEGLGNHCGGKVVERRPDDFRWHRSHGRGSVVKIRVPPPLDARGGKVSNLRAVVQEVVYNGVAASQFLRWVHPRQRSAPGLDAARQPFGQRQAARLANLGRQRREAGKIAPALPRLVRSVLRPERYTTNGEIHFGDDLCPSAFQKSQAEPYKSRRRESEAQGCPAWQLTVEAGRLARWTFP